MRVLPVPCFVDNYAYLVTADDRTAWIIDPSDDGPVLRALAEEGLSAAVVAFTHHHPDHTHGAAGVVAAFPATEVLGFGPDVARLPPLTRALADGDRVRLAGLRVEARHVPGHTLGALAYVVEAEGAERAVFTGDTLFSGGCGRLFEGTPADLWRSLDERLATLPPETRVYPGHEYTAANLRFCLSIEPENAATAARAAEVTALRQGGAPSVPSTMAIERATNVFLRAREAAVREALGLVGASDVEVLAELRRRKDAA
ncbi:MAG: hydroxyacylglutathione hydrolase [Polyangiaceae bacterium]|nr:hydroxyacylglutathione hydrolase [Polyangiaceae bacterium]